MFKKAKEILNKIVLNQLKIKISFNRFTNKNKISNQSKFKEIKNK